MGVPVVIGDDVISFRILLALHFLDLTALLLDLALLLLKLALGLIVLHLLVLHCVADRIAANSADAAADQRARRRMANGRTDYGSGTCASRAPPPVPISRSVSGCPEHPPRKSTTASAIPAVAIQPLRIKVSSS